MAADELRVHPARDRLEIAGTALLEQEREEVDLEEEVAELALELRVVTCDRRVGDLVRLLDGVRDDRERRLLAIPRALAAKAPRQLLEVEQGLRQAHRPDTLLSYSVSVGASGSSGGS